MPPTELRPYLLGSVLVVPSSGCESFREVRTVMFPIRLNRNAVAVLAIASGLSGITQADGDAIVYVTMVSHFDRPWKMEAADIAAFQRLSANHPKMRWTHLYNPVAYTQDTPLRAKMEMYVKQSRDEHGAEIGVHLHMYESLLDAAGVEFIRQPSLNAKTVDGSSDPSGYAVPMTRYSRAEITRLLEFTQRVFHRQKLGTPRTFCAGFYATSLQLQLEIAAHGYLTSAAAFPPGTEFGAQYAPSWHKLSGWSSIVTYKTTPYRVSRRSILPNGSPPFIAVGDGRDLVEIPQTCKIDWMVSAEDMKAIFRHHLAVATDGKPTAICFAIHETSGNEHFSKYDEVLSDVDQYAIGSKPRVRYVTTTELRTEFLRHWQNSD